MSDFQEMVRELESRKCQKCHGSGELDDMEPGDIFYRKWICDKCGGSGLNGPLNVITEVSSHVLRGRTEAHVLPGMAMSEVSLPVHPRARHEGRD